MGAGFFGLLGFIVGGFAISSSKMIDLMKEFKVSIKNNYNSKNEYYDSMEFENTESILNNVIRDYYNFVMTYRSTVIVIIINIISIFIVFIISCIPKQFNMILFWTCTLFIVLTFYYSIFFTLKLFVLGLKPIQLEWLKLEDETVRNLRESEWEKRDKMSSR